MKSLLLAVLLSASTAAASAAPSVPAESPEVLELFAFLSRNAQPSISIPESESDNDAILFNAACCKICSKGKACGDSCISRSYTCHKGRGCACNAN